MTTGERRLEIMNRAFQHFDSDRDGRWNGDDIGAFTLAVNPGVKFSEIIADHCSNYGKFIGGEKGLLTFGGFISLCYEDDSIAERAHHFLLGRDRKALADKNGRTAAWAVCPYLSYVSGDTLKLVDEMKLLIEWLNLNYSSQVQPEHLEMSDQIVMWDESSADYAVFVKALGVLRSRADRAESQLEAWEAQMAIGHVLYENYLFKEATVSFVRARQALESPLVLEQSKTILCVNEICDQKVLRRIPPLQVVILFVGNREDVGQFVAIGKGLKDYGHRVRLATHAGFRKFVVDSGLEFYPLGGDRDGVGHMEYDRWLLPTHPREISSQERRRMKEIIFSLLPACTQPDIDSGLPFKADGIIANPLAYGHVDVAEALGIPIHMFGTIPWTPTSEFPHPLSGYKQPDKYTSSYHDIHAFTWLRLRDIINEFRKKRLKLQPVTYTVSYESCIPCGYLWSPHLVPKPKDWGQRVDVIGYCFLDRANTYKPPEPLLDWLKAGRKPVYFGFGNVLIEKPDEMTKIIIKALELTNQRGIISKSPGGFGDLAAGKNFIYLLDNVPHDSLFLECASVVHHGGAGITAAGLKAGCPTTIIPFSNEQRFWGDRVHAKGVGPSPIPVEHFSLAKLVDAIDFMQYLKMKDEAIELAEAMQNEDGVVGAVHSFLKQMHGKPEPDRKSSFFSCCFRR